jgi:hypothetical protein
MTFRRHILVQAFIIMDFLLALSSKAKEKLSSIKAQNKSVMYQEQTLSDEDVFTNSLQRLNDFSNAWVGEVGFGDKEIYSGVSESRFRRGVLF